VLKDGTKIGHMNNGRGTRRAQTMIGFVLVRTDAKVGNSVEVIRGGYCDTGTLCDRPFD
jgi:hypothetical protein